MKINVDVNQFPSLTWNFLNINRTSLEFDADVSSEKSQAGHEFDGIVTGLGKEFDEKYSELSLPLKYYEIGCGKKNFSGKVEISPDGENMLDIGIKALEGSSGTFYLIACGASPVSGARIRVLAGEYADVHVVIVNMLGGGSKFFAGTGAYCADNARVRITELQLGGKNVYSGSYVLLGGCRSSFAGNAAYSVMDGGFLDMNYVAFHKGRETESFYRADGVVSGCGKKTWRGTIDFKKGCVESKGDEEEDVLLLSPEVTNKTLPVILCDEESVDGRHGSSIGKLDMEKLFYMQSRGIDKALAEELLTKAKVIKVTRFIEDEKLVADILGFIEK